MRFNMVIPGVKRGPVLPEPGGSPGFGYRLRETLFTGLGYVDAQYLRLMDQRLRQRYIGRAAYWAR